MLAAPDRSIVDVDMLSDPEREQILVDWNDTKTDYPNQFCVHELFEAQAEETPDVVAVVDHDCQLTYRELNACANQIAHRLREMGAAPGIPVGLYLERSTDLITTILGILKAGSPYVPLDTIYPIERRAEIINDSGMKILITKNVLVSNEFSDGLKLLILDSPEESMIARNQKNPENITKPDDLVYIIYTSGSTGKPKGVEITHQNLVNCLLSANQRMGIQPGEFSLTVTTPTFDISAFEFLAPLVSGGKVAIASCDEVYDSLLLAKRIMDLALDWMFATPITWRMLFDAGWQGKAGLKILCGGEALAPDLAERLMATCGDVYNLYGPTEATIMCTSALLKPGQPVTVGRPIRNTDIYILDFQLQPVPVGVIGELYVGGDGLSRAYHNCPELTAEKFIAHIFSEKPDARLYRTGDLARYHLDGAIDILGRSDSQVKVRGFRIELGEIEIALKQHPDIQDAIVIVREDQPGNREIVGYIVSKTNVELNRGQIQKFLGDKLPGYMIPTQFAVLSSFPVTPNGKVDRKALSSLRSDDLPVLEYTAPRTFVEQCLVRVWMDALGLSRVGINDDFFEVGGNSLSAVQVIARIQNELNVKIPIYKIFKSSRLVDLALHLENELQLRKQDEGDREEFIL
jgi:amino acid adenylation domain-containing protein